jgi:rubredoxin
MRNRIVNKKDSRHPPNSFLDPAKVRCPSCQSRLDVIETPSGARTVSVSFLGASVESTAHALEVFYPPNSGPMVRCPACDYAFDPSEPVHTIPRLKRLT